MIQHYDRTSLEQNNQKCTHTQVKTIKQCVRGGGVVKAAKCSVLNLNIKREGEPTRERERERGRESNEKRNKETQSVVIFSSPPVGQRTFLTSRQFS